MHLPTGEMMVHIPEGDYVTAKEAATIKGVHFMTVRKWISNQKIDALLIPKLGYIINIDTLHNFNPPPIGRPAKK
jgi:hypothetical protein